MTAASSTASPTTPRRLTSTTGGSPELELKTTPTGEWSTAEEDLAELAARDEFFADYAVYKTAEELPGTYLRKMARPWLHARFG